MELLNKIATISASFSFISGLCVSYAYLTSGNEEKEEVSNKVINENPWGKDGWEDELTFGSLEKK